MKDSLKKSPKNKGKKLDMLSGKYTKEELE